MKKFLAIITIFSLFFIIGCEKAKIDDKRVKNLLSQMTLEEKVGQMTQVALDVVSKGEGGRAEPHELDMEKLKAAILDYHVGSILNVINGAYTVDHWHEVITSIQDIATKETRLKIPVLYGIDAIHGANYVLGSTIFPQPIAMAATWDTELIKQEGGITASEILAAGLPWNFYPLMDIGRQPLWPRLWETFGEDVYLASEMGGNYIQGHNSFENNKNRTATCLKHYVGYSFPFSGKDRSPAWISERMLREYFLPTFEAGVKAGAQTVMINSSSVDGIPTHANSFLLKDVLRGEFKFRGVTVSDWEDIKRLHSRDKVASTPREAVCMAVNAGIDMSMVPLDFTFYNLLLECVKEGSVTKSRIDEAAGRILKLKFDLGLFDNPYSDKTLKEKFANGESKKINLQAAQEAITLLKNKDNLLPLKKEMKVLVTGPAATSLSVLNGGWTITWQGDKEPLYPKDELNLLQAIQFKIGTDNVSYVPGTTFDKEVDIPAAVEAAKDVDAVIVAVGEKPYCEFVGNIDDLTLDAAQIALVKEITKTGKPVILVLIEGRPRTINQIVDNVNSIVMGYLPGMKGAVALADVLFGDVNPSGKLPITYPRYPNNLISYDYTELDSTYYNPQFPFGFGLSYTTFSYSDLKLDKETISADENINVSVKVKNSGSVAGKEVVQLYLSDLYGSVARPARQLKGFKKIYLEPNQEQDVTFTLIPQALSFIGRDNKRITEPGQFKITIGDSSKEFSIK